MKKAIVTGACGFIGNNLVKELLRNNYDVFAIIRKEEYVFADYRDSERVNLLYYDMNDYERLRNEHILSCADVIYHLSWAGVSDELSQSYKVQLQNVQNSCDLLESTIALKVKRFVFAGSIMEYEHYKAIQEGYYNLSQRNIYHVAKNTARNLLQVIANNNDIDYLPITISNVFGPGDRSTRLINQLIISIINKKKFPLTKCEQMYDFIYIDDAVRAIRLVGEAGKKNKNYYIGNKVSTILKEYILELYRALDSGEPLGIGEKELQAVSLNYDEFDMLGIYDDLHFSINTSFSQGVKNTREWIEQNLFDKIIL